MLEKIKSFFGIKPKPSPANKAVADFREVEFLISGFQDNIWSGDSVAFGAEMLVEGDASIVIHSTAIPGDNTDTFLARLDRNILKFKPKKVLLHIGGNDFLAKKDPKQILANMKEIGQRLKNGGVQKIGWIEILPLGTKNTAVLLTHPELVEINLIKIPQFIEKVKALNLFDVVAIRKYIQQDNGFIKDEYNGGDNVHCNAKCYIDVWVPIIKEWFRT
jgi:hypothetical protein